MQIKEVENLLALTREIKQLWIAGPLRKPGDADEQTRERKLDEQAHHVSNLYNELVALQIENENKQRIARQARAAAAAAASKDENDVVEAKRESSSGAGSTHIKREDQGDSV